MPSARRAPLSHDRMPRAAITLADWHGHAALSVRILVTACELEAMSLYSHVASKDEMLARGCAMPRHTRVRGQPRTLRFALLRGHVLDDAKVRARASRPGSETLAPRRSYAGA